MPCSVVSYILHAFVSRYIQQVNACPIKYAVKDVADTLFIFLLDLLVRYNQQVNQKSSILYYALEILVIFLIRKLISYNRTALHPTHLFRYIIQFTSERLSSTAYPKYISACYKTFVVRIVTRYKWSLGQHEQSLLLVQRSGMRGRLPTHHNAIVSWCLSTGKTLPSTSSA